MELAFIFKIPVYRLGEEMPYEEFTAWGTFFKKRPLGQSEDYRAAMIISAFSGKQDLQKIFPTLVPPQRSVTETLKTSALFAKLMTAKGGEKLGFLE